MPSTADIKCYKSTVAGSLGGAITGTQIISSTFNNMFGNVTGAQRIAGEDYYNCMYVKNTHPIDPMDNFNFWLGTDTISHDSTVKWAFDAAGINGTAQTIADVFTTPTNVQWIDAGVEPSSPNIGKLNNGEYFPVWVWWHVEPNAISRSDDAAIFNFTFFIPGSGAPDPGTGGAAFDIFGIKKIFPTITGGSEWFSTAWSNSNPRTLAKNTFDPDDSDLGFHMSNDPTTKTMVIDGFGIASFPEAMVGIDSRRVFVKGPWTNTEITVYIKYRTTIWDTFQIRSRSNHHGTNDDPYGFDPTNEVSCGFGNYEAIWGSTGGQSVRNSVEVIHDLYSGSFNAVTSLNPTINTWIGHKFITRTVSGKVTTTAYTNRDISNQEAWTKESEFTYDGTNVTIDPTGFTAKVSECVGGGGGGATIGDNIAGALNANTLWTNPGYWNWIRINGGDDIDIKFFSVREIDPIDEGGGTGGGTGGGGNPPPATTDWKMAITGDWGCGATTNTIRDLCKTYDFTLGVGDNAYAAASCWTNAMASLKPNFNSCYGNHEYSESGGIAPYKTFFGHTKTYFSFNFQNVHILVMDTNIDLSAGSAQFIFAKADLEFTQSDSRIDWIIVDMHHPWWAAGAHHPSNQFNQVQELLALFTTNKVTFVVTGHNHNWQRTHQVSDSGSVNSPTIVDNTSPYTHPSGGLIHVVTGTGGHDTGSGLYSLGSQPSFQAYQNRTHNGIWEILASNNAKTLTCSFVDKDGSSKFDTFVITTT